MIDNTGQYFKAKLHLRDAIATLERYDKGKNISWVLSDIEEAAIILKALQAGA